MKVILIHNPDAGASRFTADQLIHIIRSAGHSLIYESTRNPRWHEALGEPADIIAVASGDGIVGRVAKRCIGKSIPLAILPLGTANNIAWTLGLTDTPIHLLVDAWPAAPRVPVDVGRAQGPWGTSYFIEGLGAGLFAEVMAGLDPGANPEIAQAQNRIARIRDVLRASVQKFPAVAINVTLDGQDLSGNFLLLEVMNTRSVGPNLRFAPGAHPGDGRLDLVCFHQGEQEELTQYFSEGAKTPGIRAPRLQGSRLTLQAKGLPFHIDDEICPPDGSLQGAGNTEVTVTIEENAVMIFLAGYGWMKMRNKARIGAVVDR